MSRAPRYKVAATFRDNAPTVYGVYDTHDRAQFWNGRLVSEVSVTGLYVWVLVSIVTVAPFHHQHDIRLMKEYQSTFSTQDKCNVAMRGMNDADPARTWYCEKHIVE